MIIFLYRYLKFIRSIYKFKLDENESNANKIKLNANNCGPLAIKLLQFICMNSIFKTNKLEFILENCDIHNFEDTKKMYFNDFKRDISEDYIIDNPEIIGSGSIGQVYRLYSIKLNKFVAIKVKHPDINSKVKKFNLIKKLLFFFKRFINCSEIILQFIDNINLQIDYSSEVKNTRILKRKFKKEKCVIIPTVYYYSSNFIIMSYHSGISFNSITDQKLKTSVALHMNFIMLSSLLIYDVFHGDLHFGNWKVSNENGLKIILYDCGIVYSSGNLDFNLNIIKYTGCNDYRSFLYLINEKNKFNFNLIDDVLFKIDSLGNVPTSKRIKCLVIESVKNNLIIDKKIINLLHSYIIICETIFFGIEKFNKFVYIKDDNAILFYMYHELLNNLGKFKDLNLFIKKWMDSEPVNKIRLNEWLMEEFGHTDSSIIGKIIFEKLV